MVLHEQIMRLNEFEAYLQAHPEQRVELIDGRIVEKVTGETHGIYVINIGAELRAWLKSHPDIKGYYTTDTSHRLPHDEQNLRRPDVSLRFTTENPLIGTVLGMPDFAVEIKSPSNTYQELREKARFYLANGSRLVWLVYPEKRIVEVYFADGSSDLFTEQDTLTGGDVLPEFSMSVAAIFATQ